MDSDRSSCTTGYLFTYLPIFSLPATADEAALPGFVDKHSSLLKFYQRSSQRFLRQLAQEVLVAIFKGVCGREGLWLLLCPSVLEFFRSYAVPWGPDFLNDPNHQESPADPLRTLAPPPRRHRGLHFRRRPRAAPRRRESALEDPRLHDLPAPEAALLLTLPATVLEPRLGAVTVGDFRALRLPVPARAPLLARLEFFSCEVVFPSPVIL